MVFDMVFKRPYMSFDMVSKIQENVKNTATKWRFFKSLKQMLNCLILYMVSRKELWSLICYLRHHIKNSIWFLRFGRNVKRCNHIKVFQSITFYANNWQKESYNQIIPILNFGSFFRKSVITKKTDLDIWRKRYFSTTRLLGKLKPEKTSTKVIIYILYWKIVFLISTFTKWKQNLHIFNVFKIFKGSFRRSSSSVVAI